MLVINPLKLWITAFVIQLLSEHKLAADKEGLAIQGDSPDEVLVLMSGKSNEYFVASTDSIVGIYMAHYTRDYVESDSVIFVKDDILEYKHDEYTPAENSDRFSDFLVGRGTISKLYSNGMSVLWVPSHRTYILVKDGVAGW